MKKKSLSQKILNGCHDINLDDLMFFFFILSSARGLSCMDELRIFSNHLFLFHQDDDEYDRLCCILKHSICCYDKFFKGGVKHG